MSEAPSASSFFYALIESILPAEEAGEGETQERRVSETVRFCQEQVLALPLPGQIFFRIGMTGFRAFVRLSEGRSFVDLPLPARAAIVEDWAWGKSWLCRDLFRAVRSTALLAYFDLDEKPGATGGVLSEVSPWVSG
jgi:hypothetical protein